ncbi:MAG TPA: carboxypeptidase-like regulatory domain-containing protein [Dyella sp.]|uniref:carboxypeptidase-like regulatory domain-containing protein n=1 Tax=Dyella sp. TaxID=1869338 RepID=UPI002CABF24C|nr:carboxypeptidase-like regulatory domain-containing protein [Dyella sp.]HTV85729.1 carboxypeptidase-like regulatory domain-containing protein [Dyella sp.]
MKSIRQFVSNAHARRNRHPAPKWLPVFAAGLLATVGVATAHAQETSSHIFGHAPAGEVITAQSDTGLRRHATVNDKGRYNLNSLPPGTYSVMLEKDGHTVDTRANIPLGIGGGAEVDFACPKDQCAASGG